MTLLLLRGAALGLGLGAAWGVLARVWMRLISTDPEFSWSGTLFIVGLAALLGAGVGLVDAALRAGRSRWWRLAVLPGLLLLLGPGILLAPSFLVGGLAWRPHRTWLRVRGAVVRGGSVAGSTWRVAADPEGRGARDRVRRAGPRPCLGELAGVAAAVAACGTGRRRAGSDAAGRRTGSSWVLSAAGKSCQV